MQLCDVPGYLDRDSHATAVLPHRRPERLQRRLSEEPGEISHGGVITARSQNYRLCENFQVGQNIFGENAPFAVQRKRFSNERNKCRKFKKIIFCKR